MINRKLHEIVLRRILFDLFSEATLCSQMALKGGTCLCFFHELDRFSTDLDFNIIQPDFNHELVETVLEKHLTIVDFEQKKQTYFWMGSFEKGSHRIKVEMGKREYPDKYENKDLFGLTVKTMTLPYMFAHKLCAVSNRKQLANRDVYDVWFFIKKNVSIAENIIEIRTGKSLKKYLLYLADYITKNIPVQGFLQGLGDVLDEEQKKWVKQNLIKELVFELNNLAASYKVK